MLSGIVQELTSIMYPLVYVSQAYKDFLLPEFQSSDGNSKTGVLRMGRYSEGR